jgi:hypothetical protein
MSPRRARVSQQQNLPNDRIAHIRGEKRSPKDRLSGKRLIRLRSLLHDLSRRFVQDVLPCIRMLKVEDTSDGTCDRIEGTLTHSFPAQPIVFNEAQDGSLVG